MQPVGRRPIVAVIGPGRADPRHEAAAREVGRRLALAGCTLITGGLEGVMQAASAGFQEGRSALADGSAGVVIGILPGSSTAAANAFVDVPIASGMGEGRNAIIANTADVLIGVGGEFGTLSEIALALKQGKRVISLGSWEVHSAIRRAATPEEAVELALR